MFVCFTSIHQQHNELPLGKKREQNKKKNNKTSRMKEEKKYITSTHNVWACMKKKKKKIMKQQANGTKKCKYMYVSSKAVSTKQNIWGNICNCVVRFGLNVCISLLLTNVIVISNWWLDKCHIHFEWFLVICDSVFYFFVCCLHLYL